MTIDDLVAQQEIRDVLIRYTRGIDRMDPELVLSTYWPGAHDDHGAFQGSAEDFVQWVQDTLVYFDVTMHFVGNQLVELDGPDTARAESYCVAYHRRNARDGEAGHDLVMGLRYIDRMERRPSSERGEADEWRIADRRCAFDWTRRDEIMGEWELPPEALRGTRGRTDAVYG
jgi:LmbE family N-acetylglucosaminyl deacetylase